MLHSGDLRTILHTITSAIFHRAIKKHNAAKDNFSAAIYVFEIIMDEVLELI